VSEAGDHLDRLRRELRQCQPSQVVTLGNAAMQVMALLLDDATPAPRKQLSAGSYGEAIEATLRGNP
jgi:hypothetical protein